MRDPKRIDGIYKRLAELHKMVPDMRMTQFVINLFNYMGVDPFYMENIEEFMEKVNEIVSGWVSENKSDNPV